MIEVDVLNRVSSTVENHTGSWNFYISVLFTLLSEWWDIGVFVILVGFLFVKLMSKEKISIDKTFIIISALMFFIPMILFSIPKTKIGWYMFPALIGFYFIIGYGAESIYIFLKKNSKKTFINNKVVMGVLLLPLVIGMFVYPHENIDINASSSSNNSIFLQVPSDSLLEYNGYYAFNEMGEKIDLPQSWMLHGIYLGIDHELGEEKLVDIKKDSKKLVVIKYDLPHELEEFQKNNDDLVLIGTNESQCAIFKFI